MDDDGSKTLSLEEFSDGVIRTGLEATPDEIKAMFEIVDSDKSGSINVEEFLVKVRVSLAPSICDTLYF